MSSENSSSDASLLSRLQAGEDDAATALYLRYAERLLLLAKKNTGEALATRVDAEDIVQSVFRTFFRRASSGHYQIPEGEELWKLLLVIALNKVRSLAEFHGATKRAVQSTRAISDTSAIERDVTSVEVLRLTINDLLSGLPEIHQRVVHDRIQGHEINDIALRNSVSRRTCERVLQNFRGQLQLELKPKT